jgi:hypothetical protein
VPLTNVVARAAPFQRTTDALTNALPVTITVNAEAPAVTLDGDSDSTPGTGFAIVNARSPDVPPPGAASPQTPVQCRPPPHPTRQSPPAVAYR